MCSHGRFLTISERISTMEASSATGVGNDNINKHHITLGAHGSSSNVFASPSAPPLRTSRGTSSSYGLVGTDFILNVSLSLLLLYKSLVRRWLVLSFLVLGSTSCSLL